MAPIIFKGTLNAVGFEQWLDQHLLPSLNLHSARQNIVYYTDH